MNKIVITLYWPLFKAIIKLVLSVGEKREEIYKKNQKKEQRNNKIIMGLVQDILLL